MQETATDYALLAAFVAVADLQSFTAAARKLGITKSTVSRAVAELEAQLGAELLHRNTHAVAVSTTGVALYERVAPHLVALEQAVRRLPERATEASGQLRVTAPLDFSLVVLPEILVHFARRYPEIDVTLHTTNEYVDLVAGGFDLAVRVSRRGLKDSSLVSRRLGELNASFYASPVYLARRGRPRRVGEPGHDWILHASASAAFKLPGEARVRFLCDDFLLVRNLAREGGGVALLPRLVATPLVTDGGLEEVLLPERAGPSASLFLVYPSSGQVPRKVAAFRDFLVDWLKKSPLA